MKSQRLTKYMVICYYIIILLLPFGNLFSQEDYTQCDLINESSFKSHSKLFTRYFNKNAPSFGKIRDLESSFISINFQKNKDEIQIESLGDNRLTQPLESILFEQVKKEYGNEIEDGKVYMMTIIYDISYKDKKTKPVDRNRICEVLESGLTNDRYTVFKPIIFRQIRDGIFSK